MNSMLEKLTRPRLYKVGELVAFAGMAIGALGITFLPREASDQEAKAKFLDYYASEIEENYDGQVGNDEFVKGLRIRAENHRDSAFILDLANIMSLATVAGGYSLSKFIDKKKIEDWQEERWQDSITLRERLEERNEKFFGLIHELIDMRGEVKEAQSTYGAVDGTHFISEIERIVDAALSDNKNEVEE